MISARYRLRRAVGLCLMLVLALVHATGAAATATPAMAAPMTVPCSSTADMASVSQAAAQDTDAEQPGSAHQDDQSGSCQAMNGMSCFAMCAMIPAQLADIGTAGLVRVQQPPPERRAPRPPPA